MNNNLMHDYDYGVEQLLAKKNLCSLVSDIHHIPLEIIYSAKRNFLKHG